MEAIAKKEWLSAKKMHAILTFGAFVAFLIIANTADDPALKYLFTWGSGFVAAMGIAGAFKE